MSGFIVQLTNITSSLEILTLQRLILTVVTG